MLHHMPKGEVVKMFNHMSPDDRHHHNNDTSFRSCVVLCCVCLFYGCLCLHHALDQPNQRRRSLCHKVQNNEHIDRHITSNI